MSPTAWGVHWYPVPHRAGSEGQPYSGGFMIVRQEATQEGASPRRRLPEPPFSVGLAC